MTPLLGFLIFGCGAFAGFTAFPMLASYAINKVARDENEACETYGGE